MLNITCEIQSSESSLQGPLFYQHDNDDEDIIYLQVKYEKIVNTVLIIHYEKLDISQKWKSSFTLDNTLMLFSSYLID